MERRPHSRRPPRLPLRSRSSDMRSAAVIMAVGVLAGLWGCARSPTPPASPSDAAETPKAVVQRLLNCRSRHQYHDLSALVIADRGAEVVSLLMAVDDFQGANGRLCAWLRSHVGLGLSQTIDQSYVLDDLADYAGDDLGVFSRRVTLLDEAVIGDTATVAYSIEDRVPAKRVRLRRVAGRWLYDPGPPVSEHLPAAFRDMARGLDQVLAELEAGRVTRQQLLDSPEVLQEKVIARLRRGVGLLSRAQAARGGVDRP